MLPFLAYTIKSIFYSSIILMTAYCIYLVPSAYAAVSDKVTEINKGPKEEILGPLNIDKNQYKDQVFEAKKKALESKDEHKDAVNKAKVNVSLYADQVRDLVKIAEDNISKQPPKANTGILDEMLAEYKKVKSSNSMVKVNEGFYIFVSFSLPNGQLIILDQVAKRIGAKLVMRGLKNNNFKDTINYIKEIKEDGIAIDIDPKVFEQFNVNLVPSFVLIDGDKYDKLVGNVSINYALEKFANEGDLKNKSQELLGRITQ